MDIHEGEPLLSGASARSRTVPHDERRLFTLFLLGIATAALVTFGGTYAVMKNADPMSYSEVMGLTTAHPFKNWMADNWERIAHKTLMEITLPGSHNSGNTPSLSWHEMYAGDDYYAEFVAYAKNHSSPGHPPVSQEQFYQRFVKWNINHNVGMAEQLRAGIRWFHLKVCRMPGDEPLTLAGIRHCHRGFTGPTLQSMVEDLTSFLAHHPREVVVLGINNLFGIEGDAVAELARLVVKAVAHVTGTMSADDLRGMHVGDAVRRGKRLALFMPVETDVAGVIASGAHLYENWGAAGDSGDLGAYVEWMRQDVRENATRHDRYYVLQANPNNNKFAMFDSVLGRGGAADGGLYAFIYPLLRELPGFVLDAVQTIRHARINAISTDFIYEARVVETAIALLAEH